MDAGLPHSAALHTARQDRRRVGGAHGHTGRRRTRGSGGDPSGHAPAGTSGSAGPGARPCTGSAAGLLGGLFRAVLGAYADGARGRRRLPRPGHGARRSRGDVRRNRSTCTPRRHRPPDTSAQRPLLPHLDRRSRPDAHSLALQSARIGADLSRGAAAHPLPGTRSRNAVGDRDDYAADRSGGPDWPCPCPAAEAARDADVVDRARRTPRCHSERGQPAPARTARSRPAQLGSARPLDPLPPLGPRRPESSAERRSRFGLVLRDSGRAENRDGSITACRMRELSGAVRLDRCRCGGSVCRRRRGRRRGLRRLR